MTYITDNPVKEILSVSQRHEIYKSALDLMKHKVVSGYYYYPFICECLKEALGKEYKSVDYSVIIKMFPEVMNRKPVPCYTDGFWFPVQDYQSRVEILEGCIEETRHLRGI